MSLLTELEPVAGWFSINMPRLTVLQTGPLASAVIYDKIHAMNWFEKAKDNLKKWKQQGAEPEIFYSNFTPRAIQVFALARKEAERLNHNFVGTEHVLLGLIKLGQGVAVSVLQKLGIDLQYVNFGGGSGRFGFGPGIVYGQYQSVVTISDGTATGVFCPTAAPEPGTLALSAIGGLAGLFVFRRR